MQNQSTQLEELVNSTVQGLRLLEDKLGYEFAEAIDHIQRLYDLQTEPLQSAKEYAEASGHGAAAEIISMNRYEMPEMVSMKHAVDGLGNDWDTFLSLQKETA